MGVNKEVFGWKWDDYDSFKADEQSANTTMGYPKTEGGTSTVLVPIPAKDINGATLFYYSHYDENIAKAMPNPDTFTVTLYID